MDAINQPSYQKMDVPELHVKSCQSDRTVLEITVAVTVATFIVFGALATITQMDNDLIASESLTQAADLPQPQTHIHSLTANAREQTRMDTSGSRRQSDRPTMKRVLDINSHQQIFRFDSRLFVSIRDLPPLSQEMKDHVLIFLDHKGNERFFLRFNGTPTELQIWLERLNARPESDTGWDSIRWEYS